MILLMFIALSIARGASVVVYGVLCGRCLPRVLPPVSSDAMLCDSSIDFHCVQTVANAINRPITSAPHILVPLH